MSIVLKPRMSEKTYAQSQDGVFVFDVESNVNKHQIAEAVASTYEVTVVKVNVAIAKGKVKRVYRNRKYETGKRSDVKKAYVTLKEGDSIPIFAAVEEAEKQSALHQKESATKTGKPVKKLSTKQRSGPVKALKRVVSRKSTTQAARKTGGE